MLQVVEFNLDLKEMEVHVGKKGALQKIPYDRIQQIKIYEDTRKKWFSTKVIKIIEVHVKGKEEPYVIRNDAVKGAYEGAEAYFKQIADKYHVTLVQ